MSNNYVSRRLTPCRFGSSCRYVKTIGCKFLHSKNDIPCRMKDECYNKDCKFFHHQKNNNDITTDTKTSSVSSNIIPSPPLPVINPKSSTLATYSFTITENAYGENFDGYDSDGHDHRNVKQTIKYKINMICDPNDAKLTLFSQKEMAKNLLNLCQRNKIRSINSVSFDIDRTNPLPVRDPRKYHNFLVDLTKMTYISVHRLRKIGKIIRYKTDENGDEINSDIDY